MHTITPIYGIFLYNSIRFDQFIFYIGVMHDEKVDGDANGDGAAALRCAAAGPRGGRL